MIRRIITLAALALALVFTSPTWAQSNMNNQQKAALAAGIAAETDAEFVGYRNNGQTPLMTAWLNKDATPATKAWRTNVPASDSDDATPWTVFDGLAPGKRESWVHAFLARDRDYSKQPIRKWITDTWGPASVSSDAAAILTGAGQRNITRAEKILGGTTLATTNSVSAIKLTWEGPLTDADISAALGN
jgi:hypothetical protein